MKHLYKCWQLVPFVCMFHIVTESCPIWQTYLIPFLFFIFLPLLFALFFYVSHFLVFDALFLFSLSKSSPADANSLNMLPGEHLWAHNGFLGCILSIWEVLLSFSLSALSFFLCAGLLLIPHHPLTFSRKRWLLFDKNYSHVLMLTQQHTHSSFSPCSFSFSPALCFWHCCCFLG